MTKNNKLFQLIKGIGLSSILFLLTACQDVTAQTSQEELFRSVHSSVEKLPEQEVDSDFTLRFDVERKAVNRPVTKETETTVDVQEPVPSSDEQVEEFVPDKKEQPKKEETLQTPEVPVSNETKPVEESALPTEEAIPEKEAADEKAENPADVIQEDKKVVEPVYTYEPSYETEEIPFETLYVLSDEMDNTQSVTLKQGKNGEITQTWLHAFKDGKWESKHVTKTAILDPEPEIIMVGTNIVDIPKGSTLEEEKARIEALPLIPGEF